MANQYIFSRRDFDNDKQQSSFDLIPGATISTVSDLDATFAPWLAGAQGGTFFKQQSQADSGVAASTPAEQGSLQLIIEMIDNVNGNAYKIRAPIPDLALAPDAAIPPNDAWVVSGGLTVANPAHASYGAWKAAIEVAYQSPAGNTAIMARAYIEE